MNGILLLANLVEWFRDPGNAAFAAFTLSCVALLGSVFAWLKSSKAQKRVLEIEETRERDRVEQASEAVISARIDRETRGRGKAWFLCVENSGPVEARDIRVVLEGEPVMKHPLVHAPQGEVEVLGPHSELRYQLTPSMGNPLPRGVHITWTDDSGDQGSYRTTLT